MVWDAGLIEIDLHLKLVGERLVGLRPGQLQGALRGCRRFRKPAGLGAGRSQRAENDGVSTAGDLVRPLRQFNRLSAVARKRVDSKGIGL